MFFGSRFFLCPDLSLPLKSSWTISLAKDISLDLGGLLVESMDW